MNWIIASFISAFFSGITSILIKCGLTYTNSNIATAIRTTIVLIFSWLVIIFTGDIYDIPKITLSSWVFISLSGICTGISWAALIKALSIGPASKVTIIDRSSIAITVLLSIVIFWEVNNIILKLCSLLLVGIGSILSIQNKKINNKDSFAIAHKDLNNKKYIQNNKWLKYAIVAALSASFTAIFAKMGINDVDPKVLVATKTLFVVVFAWMIVISKNEQRLLIKLNKNDLLFLFLSGLATSCSWAFYYWAIAHGQLSIISQIDTLSIVITVAFSYLILKEKINKKNIAGVLLILTGMFFLTFIK